MLLHARTCALAVVLLVGLSTACGGDEAATSTGPDDATEVAEDQRPGADDGDALGEAGGVDESEVEESGDEADGDEDVTADVGDDRAQLCTAYLDLEALERARFTSTSEAEAASLESERQEVLARLGDVLGPDAPPGVQDALRVLAEQHPITVDGGDGGGAVFDTYLSLDGYVATVCEDLAGDPAGEPAPAGLAGDGIVALGGVGMVGVGQPLEEAAAIIGFDAADPAFQEEAAACAFMDPAPGSGYDGLAFMVYDGVVQRIDVLDPAWVTVSGAGIGSTEDDLQAIYGDQVVVGPHPFDPEGAYVEFVPRDEGNAGLSLLFEVTEGTVSSWRIGFTEPVGFIEGCA